MKKLSLIAVLLSSSISAQPTVVLAPVDHLYVPQGFDSNDSVEVVVTGTFPNACFSRNQVDVKITGDVIDIKVTAISPDHRALLGERFCPQMLVPYKEVVALGNLQGGEYEIRVNDASRYALRDKLAVGEASSNSVDDDLYAAIDRIEQKSKDEYVLHGWRYSNCVEVDKVKVVPNNKDTLSLLPIMKKVSDFCPMKGMPVSFPVKVDLSSLKMKQPLFHVRTMDGKSFNQIVNLED
jgi:hypothetical protein